MESFSCIDITGQCTEYSGGPCLRPSQAGFIRLSIYTYQNTKAWQDEVTVTLFLVMSGMAGDDAAIDCFQPRLWSVYILTNAILRGVITLSAIPISFPFAGNIVRMGSDTQALGLAVATSAVIMPTSDDKATFIPVLTGDGTIYSANHGGTLP